MATSNEKRLRIRIGIFVLAAMILLALLIIWFGGVPTAFKAQDRYYVTFDNAPGVAPGTPVRRSGVRIGQVERLDLDDVTGKVRVTILVNRPHKLYQDDQPVLVTGALSGDTTIDFLAPPAKANGSPPPLKQSDGRPGTISLTSYQVAQLPPQKVGAGQPGQRLPAEPGTEFKGASQSDFSSIVREISKVTPSAQDAFVEMQKALVQFEKDLAPLMEDTLRDVRELSRTTRELVPEFRRTNDEIQTTSRNWGRLGERLDVLVQTNQDKLVKSLDSLNETLNRVGTLFNDENVRNVSATLKQVAAGTRNLQSVSKNTEDFLVESRQILRQLNDTLIRTDALLVDLQRATKPLADRTESITKNLEETTARLNSSVFSMQDLLRHVSQSDGTLRRFIDDPSLYNNVNEASCMILRTLPRLDHILKDMEVFADKLARHPESLGLRGAVAPSSGLKESPWRSQYPQMPDH